jgi:hypothetical protein
VTPVQMYMIEYLAYHVHPFSVMHLDKAIEPKKVTPSAAPVETVEKEQETKERKMSKRWIGRH